MATKYLDYNGLQYFWGKIKGFIKSLFSNENPLMNGTASPGTAEKYSREDHVHPTDTSRASASDLTAHTENTTIHVTASDKETWNAKQDALTFDSTPTENSTNPITSGGVYDALNDDDVIGNGTVTLKNNTTTLGSFTMNQKTNTNINLSDTYVTIADFEDTELVASAALNDLNSRANEIEQTIAVLDGGVVKKVKVSTTEHSPNSSGVVDLGNLVKGVKVSSTTNSPDTNGIVDLGDIATSTALDGKANVGDAVKTLTLSLNSGNTIHIAGTKCDNSAFSVSSDITLPNAFGNVKVGETTIAADSVTDTLELVAGTNVTLTPDATNDKVTITSTDTKNTAGGDDTSSKIFLVGMTSQTTSDGTNRTYTQDTAYVGTDGCLYSNSSKTLTTSQLGVANGIAQLDSNGVVPSSQLPSYVDDVVEAYPVSGATELSAGWLASTSGGTAFTPETGKIYVLMADSTNYSANTQFRWSGTTYVKLNDGGVSAITNAEIDTITSNVTLPAA